MIYILRSNIFIKIEEWNEKINSFFSNYDSPFFGMLALAVLFAFGCWVISVSNKKK